MNLLNSVKDNNLNKIKEILSKTDISQQALNNALFSACYRNNVKAVEMIIKAGANVNYECNLGTPLTEALEEENFEIAKILLEAGAVPSIPIYSEVSLPLMIAAEKGNLEIVKLLIKFGADINQIHQSTGGFALNCAAGAGYEDIFNYLAPLTDPKLRKEAKEILPIGIRERKRQENADPLVVELSDAVVAQNVDEVRRLITLGVDVNDFDEVGCTALFFAVTNNNYSIVRMLLQTGANPNLGDEDANETPLMRAINSEICSLLINAGANVDAKSLDGKSVLIMNLIMFGHQNNLDVIKLLIQAGANVNTKDNNGNTALSLAIEAENTEIIKLLKDAGAKED
ncbi:hypothetical protein cce_2492 [Crocosphaera subtropica ATCC 51142]|uniref:Uncharacterized protein n=1 Tax=Crocosphaera subtropica (strain ATCC 51142 / BH68) TaxID=43989 RepID=B1WRJ1_CROS5|nr:ankyrin repeat domain-containing protein [Crocosphaera subtropica]ACB51840.1 hypothetical protein cce_2492 [Crocosphaera subtropica ATCC 51142]